MFFGRQYSEGELQLIRCMEEVVAGSGGEGGDKCLRAAAEYLCRKRLGEAAPLDKIAARHGAQLLCVYRWYSRLFQMGYRYPRDEFEHHLETVRKIYGEAAAEEVRRLYEFLKSKGAVQGLKPGGVVAALLYYVAKKHRFKYDVVKAAYEFDTYPETVEKNIVLFQWYIHGII